MLVNTPDFGALLRRYRAASGLTQAAVAERAGLSVRGLSDLERGIRRAPYQDTLERLIKALELGQTERAALETATRRGRAGVCANSGPPTPNCSLPTPLTSFVGRGSEIHQIRRLLGKARLVTLTGAGGVGKTRLAIEAAQQLHTEMFADGVRFVGLAGVASPSALAPTIAAALGVSLQGTPEPVLQIVSYLRGKHLLLLLDSFEHLLAGVDELTEIVRGAPTVAVLVTSRERLNLAEEWVLPIEGLAYPDSTAREPIDGYPSVQLFAQRAEQLQVSFSVFDNHEAVVDICRRVEGMPLALELAATWLRVLSCDQVALQIRQSLDFLTNPLRGAADGHRSMRAVLDRSWSLLSDIERRVLARMSVFRGTFGLLGGERVTGASLTLLEGLADKSLIRPTLTDRFELHELVRQYMAEKLAEFGETQSTTTLHFDFYSALVDSAETQLYGPDQEAWYDQLELEYDNLAAALDWALASEKNGAGLRVVGALGFFWMHRGYLHAAHECLHTFLNRVGPDTPASVRAKALRLAGFFAAIYAGDYPTARAHLQESLALARRVNDQWNIAWTLADQGFLQGPFPDLSDNAAMLEEALRLFRGMEDGWGISHALRRLGWVVTQQGDYQRAAWLLDEALLLARQARNKHATAWSLFLRGNVVWFETKSPEQTMPLYRESLSLIRQTRDKTNLQYLLIMLGQVARGEGKYEQARCRYDEVLALAEYTQARGGIDHRDQSMNAVLVALAQLAIAIGEAQHAAELFGAAHGFFDATHWLLGDLRALDLDRDIAATRARLGQVAFANAFEYGRTMTTEQALGCAVRRSGMEQASAHPLTTAYERLSELLEVRNWVVRARLSEVRFQ